MGHAHETRQTGLHATTRWVFDNATDRGNFVVSSSYPSFGGQTASQRIAALTVEDIGSEAWQLSDDSFWSLKSISPPVWVAKGSGGGGGGISDPRINLGNESYDVGASVADVNRTVTGGGADNTFDIAIPDNSCVTAEVDSWVLINSKYEHLISEVLCRRISGGNVVLHEVIRNTYTPDPAGGVIDGSYHAFGISTTNLRLTRKAHPTNTGIWTTHVRLKSATKPA